LHTSHIIFEGSNIKINGNNIGIDVLDVMLVMFIVDEKVGYFLVASKIHLGISRKGDGGSMYKKGYRREVP
jgi:hypothetical protein